MHRNNKTLVDVYILILLLLNRQQTIEGRVANFVTKEVYDKNPLLEVFDERTRRILVSSVDEYIVGLEVQVLPARSWTPKKGSNNPWSVCGE